MSIENVVNGYKHIKDIKGACYVHTVERRFIDKYMTKHWYEFTEPIMSGGNIDLAPYFERRDKVFERYCKMNYRI